MNVLEVDEKADDLKNCSLEVIHLGCSKRLLSSCTGVFSDLTLKDRRIMTQHFTRNEMLTSTNTINEEIASCKCPILMFLAIFEYLSLFKII